MLPLRIQNPVTWVHCTFASRQQVDEHFMSFLVGLGAEQSIILDQDHD